MNHPLKIFIIYSFDSDHYAGWVLALSDKLVNCFWQEVRVFLLVGGLILVGGCEIYHPTKPNGQLSDRRTVLASAEETRSSSPLSSSPNEAVPTETSVNIQITEQQAAAIGQQIWRNEGSGKISNLMTWNKGENWASLGIGHFIWYPQGQEGPFTETFPDLIRFMQEQGVTIPQWLQNTPACPWRSRQEFVENSNSSNMTSLQTLMEQTISQQVQFLIRRWKLVLLKMLETLPIQSQRNHVSEQFYRVAQTQKGVYVLIDYINFKGEGTSPKERYQGQGWGLLQVLEQMSGDSVQGATEEFANVAEVVLKQRIQNAPRERNESRWLAGWKKRLDTYR